MQTLYARFGYDLVNMLLDESNYTKPTGATPVHVNLFGKEIVMKTLILLLALLFAVTLSSSSTIASKSPVAGKKRAVMQFTEPVRLMGVTLQKGDYLFVHDDDAMARGEACTFVYKGNAAVDSKLVVSFHCVPAERFKVNNFTVRMAAVNGLNELREYQFAGESEAHVVPLDQ